MKGKRFSAAIAVATMVAALTAGPASARHDPTTVVYDNFDKAGGYTVADYESKWNNLFGPLELAAGGTRDFNGGKLNVQATPFHVGADFSVFDHLKYFGVSNQTFPVPPD